MNFWTWLLSSSLWFVSFGLMLASSGLDGVYMSKWMPPGWGWLGLVLNTMADVSGMAIMYWFGRLQQSTKAKRRLSWALLPAEIVAVAYSWFFSWRQLRGVLPTVESADWPWVSAASAGFIPLLLAFIGLAQSLLAGKIGSESQTAKPEQKIAIPQPMVAEPEPTPVLLPAFRCLVCGASFAKQQALNGHMKAHRQGNGHTVAVERERAEV